MVSGFRKSSHGLQSLVTELAFFIEVSYVIPAIRGLKYQLAISISSLVSKAHQAPPGYDPGGSFL
jgi:hypothetical protein